MEITAGLVVLGGVVGAVLGLGLVVLLGARVGDFRMAGEGSFYGATFGGAMGGVLAPIAAWTLMRHVPLWRAIAETAVGTVGGAVLGLIFQPVHDTAWLSPPLLGIAGFALAAIRLRFSRARRSSVDAQAG
jgi:hypothetical protein